MGSAVGEGITRAAELALESRSPPFVIAPGGARMQEGCVSLMQMAKSSQAIARLHEEGTCPSASSPIQPTAASPPPSPPSATCSSPSRAAIAGFAGPKVIEQTIRQTLPDGFQTAEFLMGTDA